MKAYSARLKQTPDRDILVLTPHRTSVVEELVEQLGARAELYSSDVASVWGSERSAAARLRFYWVDPLLTMARLAGRVWQYGLVVNYQHRNGYWLGIVARAIPRAFRPKLMWIGFAPNPPGDGFRAQLRERFTYSAILGYDLLVCHAWPTTVASRRRYPKGARKFDYIRWGGAAGIDMTGADKGYVFAGGRTNRDFQTVLEAVTRLRAPAIFVTGTDVELGAQVPEYVVVERDLPPADFQRRLEEARIVVIALRHAEVSSGQVVLNMAMRSGKPIVVSRAGGIEDYVSEGEDALVFSRGDADDLAMKLKSLLDHPEQRQKQGLAARSTYERRFNSRVFVSDLVERVRSVYR